MRELALTTRHWREQEAGESVYAWVGR